MKRFPRLVPRDWIGLALVFAGFFLRLRQYLVNRSLWLDEAMLANNIIARDFAGLFRQLDNDQGAPVGFLLVQKLVTLALGDSEYALRLIPFLAGCLSLVLMFILARKISSAFASNLALALFVFSPALIYYSSEVKQYSSDVAIALGLCLLYLAVTASDGRVGAYFAVSRPSEAVSSLGSGLPRAESRYASQLDHRPRNDAILLALTGAFVIWVSHPALFVIGALGLALFIQSMREKDKRKIGTLLIIALVWGLSLAALYFVNLRHLASHQFFQDFWREGFLPHDVTAISWLSRSLYAPFADLLGQQTPYLVNALLFLLGMIGLTRRLPRFGLFLLLIFFLTLFASFLTLYPFAGRMILFLAPILTLLLAEGAEVVAGSFTRPRLLTWIVRLALTVILLLGPLTIAVENFTAPKTREHIRPTMEYLRDFRKDGDLVYVYHWAEHAVRFYAPKYGFAMDDFIIGSDHHESPESYHAKLDALRGHERVWFIFSHVYEDGDFNERDFILEYLDSIGELSREVRFPGTSVYLYLYDLR